MDWLETLRAFDGFLTLATLCFGLLMLSFHGSLPVRG